MPSPQAKLYMSIMEDVIESMRELILEEGLEDRVLDELKQVTQTAFKTFKLASKPIKFFS